MQLFYYSITVETSVGRVDLNNVLTQYELGVSGAVRIAQGTD